MDYTVYVLKSITSGRFYIGHTSGLDRRLMEHNDDKSKSTKKKGPWTLVYTEHLPTRTKAYGREMEIKKYKSGNAFKKLIDSWHGRG